MMGTTLLIEVPQEQGIAEEMQHMAEEVQEIYGFSSPFEALMNGLRVQLEAKKKRLDPVEEMKMLHAELTELQGPNYYPFSDEDIKEMCDEMSGGL